jgi:hypothetical protein
MWRFLHYVCMMLGTASAVHLFLPPHNDVLLDMGGVVGFGILAAVAKSGLVRWRRQNLPNIRYVDD